MDKFLGIDIGGANLKYSDPEGNGEVIYFPMWKKHAELKKKLIEIKGFTSPDAAGVVITAELSDAFRSKAEGIEIISGICRDVFDEVYFLDVNGNLKKEIDDPELFSASNWVASTLFLKKTYDNFLFVDIGSTTTDLIPAKEEILANRTDFLRMKEFELIYFGVLRTPVSFIMPFYSGFRVSSEFFSITADIFLVCGDIKEKDYTVETPDGRGKSLHECMQRISRVFCADLDEVGKDFIRNFAASCREKMISEVKEAIERHVSRYSLDRIIACGIGEFLIREAFERLDYDLEYISLKEKYGESSDFFPAFAMANLVKEMRE
ncbi:putative H4MPT-linked C1 transfer pathway protein [Archaeoglobus sulfaticallidus PM70-1]|uniref:Putative H4MPT-linked C1 transfer pathway protein n=1 Tax=Archaeoglobus sulfaticallidus PM70-1 TaxID=387631 RepID=N0BIU0_9EURY|nr:hydantoinase/oxoprolinase family protein [Archaeoglobus sulfaticallidus]AGK60391.1 putative H4MPT-linked C1 transfer pathway protein [Archaeoglobus sulfaticallidus PM70-1]